MCSCQPAHTIGGGHCKWRKLILEGNGKLFLMEKREGLRFELQDRMFVSQCCGSAVGTVIRIISILVCFSF